MTITEERARTMSVEALVMAITMLSKRTVYSQGSINDTRADNICSEARRGLLIAGDELVSRFERLSTRITELEARAN